MAYADGPLKLELRQLQKSFRGDHGAVPVLAGVDMTAHEGEFVSVIGAQRLR